MSEKNAFLNTPLYNAIKCAKEQTVAWLLDRAGANVHVTDRWGRSPLHLAAELGSVGILRRIADRINDIDQRCEKGMTALHYASLHFRPENVELLLARGAYVNAKSKDGYTALYYSVTADELADPAERTKIVEERYRTMRLLLDFGADLNQEFDLSKDTILEIAMEREDVYAINNILEHVAKVSEMSGRQLLNAKNMQMIEQHVWAKGFYKICQAELRAMRERKVGGSEVSFFDLLTDGLDKIVGYVRDERLVEDFENSDYEASFPFYQKPMRIKFYKALEVQRRVERADASFSKTPRKFCGSPILAMSTVRRDFKMNETR